MAFAFTLSVIAGSLVYFAPEHSEAESLEQLQKKSAQLQAEIAANKQRAADHHAHAETLQGKIDEINAEIAVIDKEIQLLTLQINELQIKIDQTVKELERQREVLGKNIRAMYLEGDISTIEMLASSGDLSDFVDKQQYRNSVQDKIKTTVDKITALKLDLNSKKEKIQELLDTQEKQRKLADSRRADQQRLLDKTKGEEARFKQMVAEQQKQLAEAEAALARAIGSGSYRSSPVGPVSAGSPIGGVGNSGLSSGPHLHLEMRRGGAIVNPGPYIETKPVPMPPGWVSQTFGNPDPIYKSGYHPGIDYAAPSGTQIRAIKAGYMYRGCSNDLLGTYGNPYGYVAIVEHSDGTISIYAHMSGGPAACSYNTYY